jgi:hypothetical protein
MSEEGFNGLTIFSIKKDMLDNIDFSVIINDFVYQNARRNHL